MAFNTGYTFGFATVVCVVCSLSVVSLSIGLRDTQEANRRRDFQGNILSAVGLPEDGGSLKGPAIDSLWEERIEFRAIDPQGKLVEGASGDLDGDGDTDEADVALASAEAKGGDAPPKILGVYVRKDSGKDGAYAISLQGAGLWGPISGYLALDPKAREVTGATFFAPKETPGLGAEITKDAFKQQWVGEQIVDNSGNKQAIRVVKGDSEVICSDDPKHCVDGVSGATITSRGVDAMVGQALTWYDPYLQKLRGN